MEKEVKPEGFREIEEAIREEKARAFDAFRKIDFSARVHARIRKIGAEGTPRIAWSRRLAPALIAGLAVLAGGVFVLNRTFVKPPVKGETIFEVSLRQASNLEGLTFSKTKQGGTPETGDTSSGLLSKELIKLFEQARKQESASKEVRQPVPGTEPAPRLTLEERMEILFKEQAIHRFFELYFGKNKEVGKWHADFSFWPA